MTKSKNLQKELKSLLVPVEKVEMSSLIPGIITNPQQEFGILVGEPGKQKLVSTCSKQYHLLPNSEIINPLLEMFEGRDLEVSGFSRLDSRFHLDVIFKDSMVKMNNDEVFAKLRVYNSYDGRVKYQFHLGFFRMLCTNGLSIPLEGYEDKNISKKMRHMPSLGSYLDKNAITDMVSTFTESIDTFKKPFEELQDMKVSIQELPDLLKTVADKTKFPVRQIEEVAETLISEMREVKTKLPNRWLIYNAFNYQLNHSEAMNMDSYKKEDIDREVLTLLLK